MEENGNLQKKCLLIVTLKPIGTVHDLVQTIASVVSVIAIILVVIQTSTAVKQTKFATEQTNIAVQQTGEMKKSLQSSAWQTIHTHQLEFNKIFIEDPKMRPYFDRGIYINETHSDYDKVVSIADTQLDFFDSVISQRDYLEGVGWLKDAWKAWENYIVQSFENSPIMCKRIEQVSNWYVPEFNDRANKACAKNNEIRVSYFLF